MLQDLRRGTLANSSKREPPKQETGLDTSVLQKPENIQGWDGLIMRYRFGEFELDSATAQLHGPDGPVSLRPQVFRLLEVLLEHAPELVLRDILLDEAWGQTFLSANVLPQTISSLRQALGDDSQTPRYIVTVHRRGYRLICPVERVSDNSVKRGVSAATPCRDSDTLPARPRGMRITRPWLAALAMLAVLAAVLVMFRPQPAPESSESAPATDDLTRASIALGLFPHQDTVPDWLPSAALELITRLLASDERILILRGESLGLDNTSPGARWQHAVQDLLNAPLALTGHWRSADAEHLVLDINLIELAGGRLVHGGQFVGRLDDLDALIAHASDDIRSALNLPRATASPGWQQLPGEQRRRYWQALSALNLGRYEQAADKLLSLYHGLDEPAWMAPTLARALRLSDQPDLALPILQQALRSPEVLGGAGVVNQTRFGHVLVPSLKTARSHSRSPGR